MGIEWLYVYLGLTVEINLSSLFLSPSLASLQKKKSLTVAFN